MSLNKSITHGKEHRKLYWGKKGIIMSRAYINGKFVKEVRCWKCNSRFFSNRSDAMFCSKRCRLAYYKSNYPRKRDIKCSNCGNHEICDLWKDFKGKTHPRGCMLI